MLRICMHSLYNTYHNFFKDKLFFKYTLFFGAVLASQQNCEEDTEISHLPLTPTNT